MPAVFSTRPGQIVTAPGLGAVPAYFLLANFPAFPAISAVIAEFNFEGSSILQVQPGLDGSIHWHAFGEAPRRYAVGGILFDVSDCPSDSALPPPPPGVIRDSSPEGGEGSGAEQLLKFYDANRFTKTGELLTIVSSGRSIRGALRGFSMRTVSAELRISSFQLLLDVLPPEDK